MLSVFFRFYTVSLLMSIGLTGCGGKDNRGDQRGVFLDSPVSGLKYSTGDFEGETEVDGTFYYNQGDLITFSIGELSFPPVVGASTITPLEIAQVEDVEDEKAVNILRLLQSIDQDQNPDNGIVIPEDAHEKVSMSGVSSDSVVDEDTIGSIVNLVYSGNRSLVDSQSAVEHFVDTLSQQASGEALESEEYLLTYLVATGGTYEGDFISVHDSQYSLNLDGNWESGVADKKHNILRLKSGQDVNRFVTSGFLEDQSVYCISSRPMRIDECQTGARLFAVYNNETDAKAHQAPAPVSVDATGELIIGAAQEQEPDSESDESGVQPDSGSESETPTRAESSVDAGGSTPGQNNEETSGGSAESAGTEGTDGNSVGDLQVIQTSTNCPASPRAPAQFTVFAEEPSGCMWTTFDTPPWAWTPSAAYNSDSNAIIVSEGGTYTGRFSHTCMDQSNGQVFRVEASCSFVADSAPGPADITDLFFVTGQSNAAGLETSYDATVDTPDSRVFAFTDDGWQVADLQQNWELSIPGNFSSTNSDRVPYNHVGFQLTKSIADQSDRVVGLVVLTAPGEGISHWDYNSDFFNEIRQKATMALNALPHKSEFDAMIWMQGETDWLFEGTADPGATGFTDTGSEDYVNYYPNKLFQLISNLRSENWFGFDGRFVCAETKKASLNAHLMALNSDDDSYTGCAAATDLPTRSSDPYGNHFSAESLRTLGKRIADIYLSMSDQ